MVSKNAKSTRDTPFARLYIQKPPKENLLYYSKANNSLYCFPKMLLFFLKKSPYVLANSYQLFSPSMTTKHIVIRNEENKEYGGALLNHFWFGNAPFFKSIFAQTLKKKIEGTEM